MISKRGYKFFFTAFLFSLPFWFGVNVLGKNLEDFFLSQEIARNPQVFAAQLAPIPNNPEPVKKEGVEIPQISAKAALSLWIDPKNQKEQILFRKEADRRLPLASVTKLMSVYVILTYYDLNQEVGITKEAANQQGAGEGKLKIGEVFRVKDLLYPMLIESNNGATAALAGMVGEKAFVELMNLEAKNLGLENTRFFNSTGLDPDNPANGAPNYSTVNDLAKLTKSLLDRPLIWEILSLPEFDFYTPEGVFHHKILSTNELLGKVSGVKGGKTGWTLAAQGCLVLVLRAPKDKGYLINIILGSPDRFGEMEKLIGWNRRGYAW